MATARTTTKTAPRDLTAEVAFLTRALKAPTRRESVARLAERARSESWSHEEFLVAMRRNPSTVRDLLKRSGGIRPVPRRRGDLRLSVAEREEIPRAWLLPATRCGRSLPG
jgi:hypothetical protein